MRFDGVIREGVITAADTMTGLARILFFALLVCALFFNAQMLYAEESDEPQDVESTELVEEESVEEEQVETEQVEPEQLDEAVEEEDENEREVYVEEQQHAEPFVAPIESEAVDPPQQQQPFVDLSNNPSSYSGNKSILIERSSNQQKLSSERVKEDVDQRFADKPCDPIVNIQVNEEKSFDVLSKLAEEHAFDISMLETENMPISIEKNQPLSEVVESITRKMNVVLNFQTVGACKRLVSIAVLNDKEWAGSGAGVNSFSGIKGRTGGEERELKFISPKFTKLDAEEKTQEQIEAEEERREAYRKSVERNGGELLNDTLENGAELNNAFSVKGNSWKIQKENIEDMETYVQEVLSGDRTPNVRGMTSSQRKEYMRLRREYQSQQQ